MSVSGAICTGYGACVTEDVGSACDSVECVTMSEARFGLNTVPGSHFDAVCYFTVWSADVGACAITLCDDLFPPGIMSV